MVRPNWENQGLPNFLMHGARIKFGLFWSFYAIGQYPSSGPNSSGGTDQQCTVMLDVWGRSWTRLMNLLDFLLGELKLTFYIIYLQHLLHTSCIAFVYISINYLLIRQLASNTSPLCSNCATPCFCYYRCPWHSPLPQYLPNKLLNLQVAYSMFATSNKIFKYWSPAHAKGEGASNRESHSQGQV